MMNMLKNNIMHNLIWSKENWKTKHEAHAWFYEFIQVATCERYVHKRVYF